MAKPTNASLKRNLIDKANSRIVATVVGACFIVVFCVVSGHVLFSQLLYQNRIISAKKQALSQLKVDQKATSTLVNSYKSFVNTPQNVLGGNPSGTGSQDGDNAKIVLDALPSKYDFPALTSSLEKLLTSQGVAIQSISGTDDEVAQSANQGSGTPSAVPMPFQITVNGNYNQIENVVKTFQSSIRPIQIQTMNLSGSDKSLTLTMTAQTFYQPEKDFVIGSKEIK